MPDQPSGLLLIARPGRLRASLPVFLKSLFPNIFIVLEDEKLVISEIFSNDFKWFVLVDADLTDNQGWQIAEEINRLYPEYSMLLLINHSSQMNQANKIGINALLMDGMSAKELTEFFTAFINPDG